MNEQNDRFAGGLYDLSVLAAKQGATLSIDTGEEFTLILRFPKNVLKISHVADDKTVPEYRISIFIF